jgi:hypothetical protein
MNPLGKFLFLMWVFCILGCIVVVFLTSFGFLSQNIGTIVIAALIIIPFIITLIAAVLRTVAG